MISNIAFYRFTKIDDPQVLCDKLKSWCARLNLLGTILIASEGINGMLAGEPEMIQEFVTNLQGLTPFTGLTFRKSISERVPFRRLLVKVKKEILTLRKPEIDPAVQTAPPMKSTSLHALLQEKANVTLIDVRNEFEVEMGSFEGAIDPHTKSFSEFSEFAKNLDLPKDKMIVTFCTGGIRCEKATTLLMNEGFKNVFQLEGGILEYFAQTDGAFFNGQCFVFDERISLDRKLQPVPAP